ncbi:MAG TPA: hypothetical protein P5155_02125, partial [Candidatus Absconditabacterales bacterium]|nr:hypothetical protein [Candidatus Absconditabacterales bacterium]
YSMFHGSKCYGNSFIGKKHRKYYTPKIKDFQMLEVFFVMTYSIVVFFIRTTLVINEFHAPKFAF